MIKSIIIGSDHAGYELKNFLWHNLRFKECKVIDIGTDNSRHSVDYNDYAINLAFKIKDSNYNDSICGILICRSGIGMNIAANRYNWIRCALCTHAEHAVLARQHNDANVLALGSWFVKKDDALNIVKTFISVEFMHKEPYVKRIKKLSN